jgi:hypothetical protein
MSEREEYDELECDDYEECEECGFEISECCCDYYDDDDEMDIDYDEEDYE